MITPSKSAQLKYLTMDKYSLGRKVDELLMSMYIGDGENIFFREKQKFRNQMTIKYEIENEVNLDLSFKKFHVSGHYPKQDSCVHCQYLNQPKRGKSWCKYYKEFLDRKKSCCVDFLEKD